MFMRGYAWVNSRKLEHDSNELKQQFYSEPMWGISTIVDNEMELRLRNYGS